MPRDGYNYFCDCCGITEDQIDPDLREKGIKLNKKEVRNSLDVVIGHLTLCSWCYSSLYDDLGGKAKEKLAHGMKQSVAELEEKVTGALGIFKQSVGLG